MSALLTATGLALPKRLDATSLSLAGGELACLIGPNGSGKTSLLHALGGIGAPAGSVRIGGIDPRGAAPGERRRLLAYLPASREVAWPVTARDLIALGAPGEELGALATELELEPLLERRVDRLSTGERSRVLIARALAARPRVVLLDEPAANLDPLWQLRLMEHLGRLARSEGRGVLMAVHDLELACRYADRLIVMDRGGIVADDPPTALLAGPHIPRVFGVERVEGVWRAVVAPS